MHISCALEKIDDIPGARTTLRCTGYGRVAPNVLAWRKAGTHLNIDNKNYEIRTQNKSSQLLIIKDYTMKHLGRYGCIVGIGINRSLCTLHVTGLFDYKVANFRRVLAKLSWNLEAEARALEALSKGILSSFANKLDTPPQIQPTILCKNHSKSFLKTSCIKRWRNRSLSVW